MTRLEKLVELRGEVVNKCIEWREVFFSDLHGDLFKFHENMTMVAKRAYDGSLDAAKVLHDALLPGWHWLVRLDEERGGFANVMTEDFSGYCVDVGGDELKEVITSGASFPEYAETAARAWLIAILSALIAHEQDTLTSG